jgi:ABC-2 type transport system ATP-binding protein
MSVKAENVTKLYGKQAALKNVSFEINSGEIVGFIGPNGAGKSTMMRIITGYIPQTEGSVSVNNVNVLEKPLEAKQCIGYLPENNPLYSNMYVKEYLGFVAGLYKLGRKTNDRVNEIIRLTGLEPEKQKQIGSLSKGYRQRVGLAQALIHDPSVLILDEPTSGLDPNQIVEIRDLIKQSGQNKTVMLSTHIMQEVEAICERIIIISNGEIVADDKTANIYSHVQQAMTIVVEFNADIDEKQLHEIKGISKIAKLEKQCWLIETPITLDIREKVFEFAVKRNIAVLSMQKKEKSLEEVFRELTTK